VLTTDPNGVSVTDSNGRCPGIYTYLAGAPNRWSKAQIDHNLRRLDEKPSLTAGLFDRNSVMLYRFPELFYKTVPSPCSPLTDGISLSDGDQHGLQVLYPHFGPQVEAVVGRRTQLLATVEKTAEPEMAGLELPASELTLQIRATLRATRAH
jgi:hypothetical protein